MHVYSKIFQFHKKVEPRMARWSEELELDQRVKEKQSNDSILFNDSAMMLETVSEDALKGNQMFEKDNSDEGFKILIARRRSKRMTIEIGPSDSECFAV